MQVKVTMYASFKSEKIQYILLNNVSYENMCDSMNGINKNTTYKTAPHIYNEFVACVLMSEKMQRV